MKKFIVLSASVLSLNATIPMIVSAEEDAERITALQEEIAELQAELDKLLSNSTSNDEDETSHEDVSEDDEEQGNSRDGNNTQANSNLGSRSNPVPLGETIEFTERVYLSEGDGEAVLDLTIIDAVRGQEAYDILASFRYDGNLPTPDGHEWVVVEVELDYLEGDEDEPYGTRDSRFTPFSRSGKEIRQTEYSYITQDEFRGVDLYPGNSHRGLIAFHVEVGEDVVLVFDDYDNRVFFEITDEN